MVSVWGKVFVVLFIYGLILVDMDFMVIGLDGKLFLSIFCDILGVLSVCGVVVLCYNKYYVVGLGKVDYEKFYG